MAGRIGLQLDFLRQRLDLASGFLIFGLLVSLAGACWTATAVVIDEKTADQLAATKWGENAELKRALLDQSHAARNGLILVAVGSAFQVVGVVLQARSGARRGGPRGVMTAGWRRPKFERAVRDDIDLYSIDQLRRFYHARQDLDSDTPIKLRNSTVSRDEVTAEIHWRLRREEFRFWLLAVMAFVAALSSFAAAVLAWLGLSHVDS